jgi:hypothetical protein
MYPRCSFPCEKLRLLLDTKQWRFQIENWPETGQSRSCRTRLANLNFNLADFFRLLFSILRNKSKSEREEIKTAAISHPPPWREFANRNIRR